MRLNENFKNVPIYQPGKSTEEVQKEFGLKQVIKLASNENPFGTSKKVRERLLKEMDYLTIYPDAAGRNLKEKIAALHGINEGKIMLGNGSDELISFLSRVYLNPNTEVIMATPSFPMYKANAMMEGAVTVEVPVTNGIHDLDRMAAAITDKTAMIWVCNPNNPTGTFVPENELVQFLDKVPQDILVILDEAYAEYVVDPSYPNTIKLMDKYSNIIILRTFSKIYGLAALRIGYGIANENIIQDLLRVKDPFNTNHFAQASAEEAILDQEFVQYCREQNEKSKNYFLKGLEALNIDYYPSETNFILVKHNMDDELVFNRLIKEGIIIRPGNKLGIPRAMRITLGTIEQLDRVLNVLKQLT